VVATEDRVPLGNDAAVTVFFVGQVAGGTKVIFEDGFECGKTATWSDTVESHDQ
jgi:hypothetical protein